MFYLHLEKKKYFIFNIFCWYLTHAKHARWLHCLKVLLLLDAKESRKHKVRKVLSQVIAYSSEYQSTDVWGDGVSEYHIWTQHTCVESLKEAMYVQYNTIYVCICFYSTFATVLMCECRLTVLLLVLFYSTSTSHGHDIWVYSALSVWVCARHMLGQVGCGLCVCSVDPYSTCTMSCCTMTCWLKHMRQIWDSQRSYWRSN